MHTNKPALEKVATLLNPRNTATEEAEAAGAFSFEDLVGVKDTVSFPDILPRLVKHGVLVREDFLARAIFECHFERVDEIKAVVGAGEHLTIRAVVAGCYRFGSAAVDSAMFGGGDGFLPAWPFRLVKFLQWVQSHDEGALRSPLPCQFNMGDPWAPWLRTWTPFTATLECVADFSIRRHLSRRLTEAYSEEATLAPLGAFLDNEGRFQLSQGTTVTEVAERAADTFVELVEWVADNVKLSDSDRKALDEAFCGNLEVARAALPVVDFMATHFPQEPIIVMIDRAAEALSQDSDFEDIDKE